MPNYSYKAKSFSGDNSAGVLTAKDERELAQMLKAQGMILIEAADEGHKKGFSLNMQIPLFGSVSATQKIMMTRNLGVMFSTGLSLTKIFDILSMQSKNKNLKSALADIKEKINRGENLSDALNRYPKIFSELFVNMIKVGEESGTLDEIFQVLSLQLGKEHELKSKIKTALIYPCIILLVMVAIGGVVVTIVLPSLNLFFTSLAVDIPIHTKILLAVGRFMSERWYVVLAGSVSLVAALYFALKTGPGKWFLDTFLLRLPLIAPIIKKTNSAGLVRSLSSLISSGVSLIRALEISSKTIGNHYFQEALAEAGKQVKKGEKLSNALKPYQNLFPVGVVEMVEVGEETGKTSVILKKLADFYEEEAASAIEKLTIIIEPIMIIVLGLAVGFFAFSIIQPMYSSLKSIGA